MTDSARVEIACVFFRRPGPEDWSPRVRRALEAATRLAASLVCLEAVEAVAGWPRSRADTDYAIGVPYWRSHKVIAAGLLFKGPKSGLILYHTWILEDGTLDVLELLEGWDPDVRAAVADWAERELSAQEPSVNGFEGWRLR